MPRWSRLTVARASLDPHLRDLAEGFGTGLLGGLVYLTLVLGFCL